MKVSVTIKVHKKDATCCNTGCRFLNSVAEKTCTLFDVKLVRNNKNYIVRCRACIDASIKE